MKKVINYLGLRKVAINLQLDKLPPDVDQYVAEVGAELEEELRQIDQALLVLSNVVGQSEQFKAIVFKMANMLAVAGKGDQAVQMHRIHNSL